MEYTIQPPHDMLVEKPHRRCGSGTNGQVRKKADGKRDRSPVESHEYFLSVHITADGQSEVRSSSALKNQKLLMEEPARQLESLYRRLKREADVAPSRHRDSTQNAKNSVRSPNWKYHIQIPDPPYYPESQPVYPMTSNSKRRRIDSHSLDSQDMILPARQPRECIPSNQIGSQIDLSSSPQITCSPLELKPKISIMVSDQKAWDLWFSEAFRAIQQQACRYIAKEWIKLIHPKKQSTHPYNGNFPRNQRASPERTRPPYWPPTVRHKEPDHIDKDARTKLLVHLLMKTPQTEITQAGLEGNVEAKVKVIMAEDLRQALTKKQEELSEKWVIIEEVIKARKELEIFEDGGYDPDTTVSVTDFQDHTRPAPNTKKSRGRSQGTAKEAQSDVVTSGGGSCVATPVASASPAPSTATMVDTGNDDDDEDDDMALNRSFTTTTSSRSAVRPILPAKPEAFYENHIHPSTQSAGPPQSMLGHPHPAHLHTAMDYRQHTHMQQQQQQHRQSLMSRGWPTTTATNMRLGEAYANTMIMPDESMHHLDPAHMDHTMYSTARPTTVHGVISTMAYHGQHPFMLEYEEAMEQNMGYQAVPEMHQSMDPNHNYAMHEQYCSVYGHAQPSQP